MTELRIDDDGEEKLNYYQQKSNMVSFMLATSKMFQIKALYQKKNIFTCGHIFTKILSIIKIILLFPTTQISQFFYNFNKDKIDRKRVVPGLSYRMVTSKLSNQVARVSGYRFVVWSSLYRPARYSGRLVGKVWCTHPIVQTWY